MSKRKAYDRRVNVSPVTFEAGMFIWAPSRTKAGVLIVLSLILTGWLDDVTGPDLWFGPFYLLIIGVTAWFVGRWQAFVVAVVALTISIWVNGWLLYPFGTIAAVWNLATRLATIVVVINLLHRIRASLERECRLARTDPLTGALNRQAYFELAARSSTSDNWIMLAYADLDGMKRLNDERGHAAGDSCLKVFVAHVRSTIRKQDHFARLGGDEFLIHAKVRDEAAAMMVGERLHRTMNTIVAEIDPQLGCSLGVLILPPGNRTLDREVLAADRLMYEAKQQGAGLVVATLRDVHGSQFLLQHWTQTENIASNAVVNDHFTKLEERYLDTAA